MNIFVCVCVCVHMWCVGVCVHVPLQQKLLEPVWGPPCLFVLCHGTEDVNVPDKGCCVSLSLAGKMMGTKPQLTFCGRAG